MLNLSVTMGFMPGPTVTGTPQQWERVATAVQQRRLDRGMNQDDLGVSKAVASALENARQEAYSRATLMKVSRALGWTADSIEKILTGDEPVEHTSSGRALADSDMLRRLDALEAELRALRAELGHE